MISLVSVVLFAAILSGYLLSGNRAPFDSALYLHTSLSLVREGNTDLNEYPEMVAQVWWPPDQIDGRWYDTAPIGTPVLVAPIMLAVDRVSAWLGWGDFNEYLKHNLPENLQSVLASVIVALTVVLLYHIARRELTSILCGAAGVDVRVWHLSLVGGKSHVVAARPVDLDVDAGAVLMLLARDQPARIQYLGLIVAAAYVIRPTNSIAVIAYSLFVLLFYRRIPVALSGLGRGHRDTVSCGTAWSIYHAFCPILPRFLRLLANHVFSGVDRASVSPSRGLLIFSPMLILRSDRYRIENQAAAMAAR